MTAGGDMECDYVVVGSGAGGGTVAARLAEAGMHVVVLEAGDDCRDATGPRIPEDYDVPAFHPFAAENAAMRWDFFVSHYADAARQKRDPKAGPEGVLYPRSGALGGCTAHNAMIFMAPHDSDWNAIAALTGDKSWRAAKMQRYFRRVENCGHHPLWRALAWLGFDPTGHGWRGWLRTEVALPRIVFRDDAMTHFVRHCAWSSISSAPKPLRALWRLIRGEADPNNRRVRRGGFEGVCYTPLTTRGHRRTGTRERLLAVAARHPDRLHIEMGALATAIVFDDDNRAIGVDYLKGENLYRAHAVPTSEPGTKRRILARREVILCGGAFNTPQLLMLSGVGPAEGLRSHGIAVRVDLPGVGRNLQDRYEIGVVYRMTAPWKSLAGARFERDDPLYRDWRDARQGMYISNGAAVSIVQRSAKHLPAPDLFCMALVAHFEGYFPGYSRLIAQHTDYLTWAILKAHTQNRAGTVSLRSSDPRDTPRIEFNYFAEDKNGQDLKAVVEGIRFARCIMASVNACGEVAREEKPGPEIQCDEALAQYVQDNAWGHHACGTCAIGPREAGGVLNSAFAVHGTKGLRVVDASVFPRIPGFFIVSAIYMAAEKAADVILAAAKAR
ncbi:MAG TPA: GMC family oxidoreductase [Micropepsaceae bacterium]|nr:GMC family oxidoreductase [Micropepsaceae bacterium]